MVNDFSTQKALQDKLVAGTSIKVVRNGEAYEPKATDTYIEQKRVGDKTSINLSGSDVQRGIYQINVCAPINEGELSLLNKAVAIKQLFGKGISAGIAHNGQKVSIQNIDVAGLIKTDTHYKQPLSVYYTVIG